MPTLSATRQALVTQIARLLTPQEIKALAAPAPKKRPKARHRRTRQRLADPVTGGTRLSFRATVVDPEGGELVNREFVGQTAMVSGLYDARGPKGGRWFVGEIVVGRRHGRLKTSAAQIEKLFGHGATAPRPVPVFALWDGEPSARLVGYLASPTV
jgi:hypothetical protein